VSVVYCWLMSDKNLEQRMNIKFWVRIGKSVSKILALLTLAYGKYDMEKSRVFLNGIGGSRKGETMCKMAQEVGSQSQRADISGERTTTIDELETTLAVTRNRRSVLWLLVTANLFLARRFLSPSCRSRYVPPKHPFLQESHGVKSQKTAFS
jgi:hypothetical protein